MSKRRRNCWSLQLCRSETQWFGHVTKILHYYCYDSILLIIPKNILFKRTLVYSLVNPSPSRVPSQDREMQKVESKSKSHESQVKSKSKSQTLSRPEVTMYFLLNIINRLMIIISTYHSNVQSNFLSIQLQYVQCFCLQMCYDMRMRQNPMLSQRRRVDGGFELCYGRHHCDPKVCKAAP